MKRFTAWILALVMVFTMLPVQALALESEEMSVIIPITNSNMAMMSLSQGDTLVYASTRAINVSLPKIPLAVDEPIYDARIQAFTDDGEVIAQTEKLTVYEWDGVIYATELYFFEPLPEGEYALKLVYGDVQNFTSLDLPCTLCVVDAPVITYGSLNLFAGTTSSTLMLEISGYRGDSGKYSFALIDEEKNVIPCTAQHIETEQIGYRDAYVTYALTPVTALIEDAEYALQITAASGELYTNASAISSSAYAAESSGLAVLSVDADSAAIGGLQIKVGGVSADKTYSVKATLGNYEGEILYSGEISPKMENGNGVFSIVLKRNGLTLPLTTYGYENIYISVEGDDGEEDSDYYYNKDPYFNQYATLELIHSGTNKYAFVLESMNILLDLYEKDSIELELMYYDDAARKYVSLSKCRTVTKETYTENGDTFYVFEGVFTVSTVLPVTNRYSIWCEGGQLGGTNSIATPQGDELTIGNLNVVQWDYEKEAFYFNYNQLVIEAVLFGDNGSAQATLYDNTDDKAVSTSPVTTGVDGGDGTVYLFFIPKPETLNTAHTYSVKIFSDGETISSVDKYSYYAEMVYDDTVQEPEYFQIEEPAFAGVTTVVVKHYDSNMQNMDTGYFEGNPIVLVNAASEVGLSQSGVASVAYKDRSWFITITLEKPLKAGEYKYEEYRYLSVLPVGTVTLGGIQWDREGETFSFVNCCNLSEDKEYTGVLYGDGGKVGDLTITYISDSELRVSAIPENLADGSYIVEIKEDGMFVGTVNCYIAAEDEEATNVVISAEGLREHEDYWQLEEIIYQTESDVIYLTTYLPGYAYVRYSEDENFTGVSFKPIRESYDQPLVLSGGTGEKTVYVQFKKTAGTTSAVYSWSCEKVDAVVAAAIVGTDILVDGVVESTVPEDTDFVLQLISTSQLTSAYAKFVDSYGNENYQEYRLSYAGKSGDNYVFRCTLNSGDYPFQYSETGEFNFYLADFSGETIGTSAEAVWFGRRELVLDAWNGAWEVYTRQENYTITGWATPNTEVTISWYDASYTYHSVSVMADEDGRFSAVLSDLIDGDRLYLDVEDSNGLSDSAVLCVDLTAPELTSIKATMEDSGSGVVTWECEEDNLAYFLLWRNGILIKGEQDNYTATSYIAANAEGDVFDVMAVDMAGNCSEVATVAMRDEEPPTVPGIPVLTAHSTKSLSFSWEESIDNVAVYEYLLYLDEDVEPVAVLPYTTTTYDVENLMEGTSYTYSVAAIDRAGNVSEKATATLSTATLRISDFTGFESEYIIEEERYGITLSLQLDTSDQFYDLSDAVAKFQYKVGDEAWTDIDLTKYYYGGRYSGTWEIENLDAGAYAVRFHVVDGAGTEKTSAQQAVIISHDAEKPVATLTAPRGNQTYGGAGISVDAYATDNAGVANIVLLYAKEGDESFTEITTLTNKDEFDYFYPDAYTWRADTLASGTYTIRAVAYDLRGNESEPSELSITIDNTPPAIPTGVTATGTSRYTHIMWDKSYMAPIDFSSFNVYRADAADGSFERVGGGKTIGFYDDGETAETEKVYYYYVTAEDKYGNESLPTATVSAFIIADSQKPTIQSMSPADNAGLRKSVTLRVSAEDNYRLAKAVFEYRAAGSADEWTLLGEDVLHENKNATQFVYEWDISALSGSYEVRARVYDVSINDVDTSSGMSPNDPAIISRTVTISKYALPVAPVVAVDNGYKEAVLRWTYGGNLDTLSNFAVYACDADGNDAKHIATIAGDSSGSYIVSIAVTDKHYFKVAAIDIYGAVAHSAVVTAESIKNDPIAPSAVIMPETLTAAVGVPFTFSAVNSTDNDVITSYAWDFGDGSAAGNGVSVQHTYAVAGVYTVKLTVKDEAGNEDAEEKTIAVYDVAGGDATHAIAAFTIVDAYTEGTPAVPGAEVKVFDNKGFETTSITDDAGQITVIAPVGEVTVSVVAKGFTAATRSVRVAPDENGAFAQTVGIAPSNVSMVDGSLSYTEMTYEEILEAGIDVSDPDNQHVWKFAAVLEFTAGLEQFTLPVTSYFNSAGNHVGGSGWGWNAIGGGGAGGWGGLFNLGLFPISENFVLVIYGEAHWLKEMYNVELLVINNSYIDDITDCVATLALPEGLSLAAMTSGVQSATIDIGTIAHKTTESDEANTATATWYVRGDAAGEYNLTATVTGNNPTPFTMTFTTDKPLKVYAGDALKLTIMANDYTARGEQYPVTFRLENVSDKPLYNLSFGITGVEQFKILRMGNQEAELPIDGEDFGDQFIREVGELEPGEYIEIEMSTTIWFNSVAEVGEMALKSYLNTKGLGALGNFVNVVYYLQDVSVISLEGSTTTIPHEVVINKVERPNLLMTVYDAAKALYKGEEPDATLMDQLVEVFGYALPVWAKEGSKILLSLPQGSTDYDVRITIADGTKDGLSLKNEYISITSGSDAEFVFDQLNGITVDFGEDGEIEINGLKNGETELNINISKDDFSFDYKIPVTIGGETVDTSFDLEFNADTGAFTLDSDVIKDVIDQVQEKEGKTFNDNPYLWFASHLNLNIAGKPGDLESVLTMDEGVLDDLLAETVVSYVDINGNIANLSIDRTTLEKIMEAGSGEDAVKVIMREMGAEVAEEKFGIDRPTYEFLIQVGDDVSSEIVSKFGEGEVAVQIPYELQEGERAEDIEIHRVKENGSYEIVPSEYDSAAGLVTFTTDQFSYYRIGIKKEIIPDGLWCTEIPDQLYTGKALKPEIEVYHGDTLLTLNKDYSVSYKNNTNVYAPVDTAEELAAFEAAVRAELAINPKAKAVMVGDQEVTIAKVPQIIITGKGNYGSKETIYFAISPVELDKENFLIPDLSAAHTGKNILPKPVVTWNETGKAIKWKTDYEVYLNYGTAEELLIQSTEAKTAFIDEGNYILTVVGKGNFSGTATVNYDISEYTLMSKVKIGGWASSLPWSADGAVQTALVLTDSGKKVDGQAYAVTEGVDYTVSYRNNNAVGTATAVFTGMGEYIGQVTKTFKITGLAISKAQVEGIPKSLPYTGEPLVPSCVLIDKTDKENPKELSLETDYTVSYSNNVNKGTATILFTGINEYTGTLKKTFKIDAYDVNGECVVVEENIVAPYMKGGAKPVPTITFDGKELVAGTDYTLAYKNNTTVYAPVDTAEELAAFEATLAAVDDPKAKTVMVGDQEVTIAKVPQITITGKGNFAGKLTVNFAIEPKELSKVDLVVDDKAYTPKAAGLPTVTLTDTDGKKLAAGKDYDKMVSYTYTEDTLLDDEVTFRKAGDTVDKKDIIPVGTVLKVSVVGNGTTYMGEASATYRIVPQSLAKATVKVADQEYTGKPIIPDKSDITVTVNKVELEEDDYEIVSCTNNVNKGSATLTIRGVGDNYGGIKTVKFKIDAKTMFWYEVKTALFGFFS